MNLGDFMMPFGHHQGMRLRDIIEMDGGREHLRNLAYETSEFWRNERLNLLGVQSEYDEAMLAVSTVRKFVVVMDLMEALDEDPDLRGMMMQLLNAPPRVSTGFFNPGPSKGKA